MRVVSLISFLLLSFISFSQGKDNWFTDYNKALKSSQEKNLPVLINFSGSDWCKPCMLLSKTIFQTDRFRDFAKDSIILLHLDFPRKKKNKPLNEEILKREQLAEKYNRKGIFPLIVFIDSKGAVLAETGYKGIGVDEYIAHIKNLLKDFYLTRESLKEELNIYKKRSVLMGVNFEITVIHHQKEVALSIIERGFQEISRIEKLISSWDKESQTSLINQNAGISPVVVDLELFDLIRRSKKISVLTEGSFDISYASMDEIWLFNQSVIDMPSEEIIESSIANINYNNIILNEEENSVLLKKKGMKIGFGAIGKGYAANKVRYLMKKLGIDNGMVNAGGDLIAWGNSLNNKKWKVGIADPKKRSQFISWIEIQDQAIVTSGDYERYVLINGERYSHIIDPRTGYPAKGIKSVTIICPDAELADALATSVFVLGSKEGIELIDAMSGFECIIIDDMDNFITSEGIELQLFDIQKNKS